MKFIISQVLVCSLVGLCSSYPSYSQDGRFFYQVPIQSSHGHLLASLTPQQQQFVQQADPFAANFQRQPYFQTAGFGAQDNRNKKPIGQQQLLGQQLLGQHQVLYFGGRDGTEEGGASGGSGATGGTGSSGGYVDSILGILGSYWPGQGSTPDNTVQPAQPAESGAGSPAEAKPEKQEEIPKEPVLPSVSESNNKYYHVPAVRVPQRYYSSAIKQPQFSDFHREMLDSGLSMGTSGNAPISFQNALAAARLKAAQAGVKASLAEQEAHSISAEEAKEENSDDKEPSEQDQYGPSIAQAKPQAVSVAGQGGVAAAAPVGTAVVGPGGMALSAPHATAVAGAPRRPPPQDDKLSRLSTRHQAANIPPSSYFYRY